MHTHMGTNAADERRHTFEYLLSEPCALLNISASLEAAFVPLHFSVRVCLHIYLYMYSMYIYV